MAASLTIDSSGFRAALRGLSTFTGLDVRTVIRAEAGSILKACAGDTKVATAQQADRRARLRAIKGLRLTQAPTKGDISVNAGWRPAPYGRVWIRVASARRFAMARQRNFARNKNRFSRKWTTDIAEAVEDVRGAVGRAIARGRAAIGLSRQSWVQIADAAGMPLERVPGGRISAAAIAKARAAIASDGTRYLNGTARALAENKKFVLALINRLPYGRRIALDRILAKNVNARAKFYRANLARGVFDRISSIARAYPGLRVRLLN